jgi:hypothetical protein
MVQLDNGSYFKQQSGGLKQLFSLGIYLTPKTGVNFDLKK